MLPWPQRKFQGYYKIARHYKWAIKQVFESFGHNVVIVVEGKDGERTSSVVEFSSCSCCVLHVVCE